MTRSTLTLLIAAGALPFACTDSASGEPGSGGGSAVVNVAGAGSSGSSGAAGTGSAGGPGSIGGSGAQLADAGAAQLDAGAATHAHHLGKPFTIVDGRISADSNEYGLAARFYAINDPADPAIEVTRSSGSICVHGSLRRAVLGDVATYWGITFGFITVPDEFITLSSDALSISPAAPPWDLGAGHVLGIAATVSGSVLPNAASFGLSATPGGQDPSGLSGVEQAHTLFGDCSAPPVTSSGQVIQSLFGDLSDFWCLPQYMSPWTADSASLFFWGLNSVIVESDAGADVTDPYDFCLSDIRPVVLGAGPDEPLEPTADAGVDAL